LPVWWDVGDLASNECVDVFALFFEDFFSSGWLYYEFGWADCCCFCVLCDDAFVSY
jgi:hypothetical protein